MADVIYRFSRCEVDPQARELRVDAQVQTIEPRPFDVLVLLLRHRHRTVSVDELLDTLWHGECVAPGSVTTAMAKVRCAIGDRGRPSQIRTIRRVGYRFVGNVVEAAPFTAPPSGRHGGRTPLPVALLPFENLAGTPSLDWVALGLMSLACHALSQHDRLAPVPVSVVVDALRHVAEGAGTGERARAVQAHTGVRHVVYTRLRRSGDTCLLDCRLVAPGCEVDGVLQAPDPAALGRALAHWVLAQLAPEHHPMAEPDAPAVDPWAQAVRARGLEACAARQWMRAEALLAVVLDVEPAQATARLEWLQARAMLSEADGRFGAALDLWRETTTHARASGMSAVATRANGRAALAAAMCGLRDEAMARAEDGLAEAQARSARGGLWRHAALLGQVLAMVGEPRRFAPMDTRADADGLPDDARAAWWSVRGHALAQDADHAGAAAAFAQAAHLYGRIGAVGREGSLLMWQLDSLLLASRVDEAGAVLARADACIAGHGLLLRWLPWCRARLRAAQGDRRGALDALAPLLSGPARDLAHAAASALAARCLAEGGRIAQARDAMAGVGEHFARHPRVRGT